MRNFDLVGDISLFTVWKSEVGKIGRGPLGKWYLQPWAEAGI